MRIAMTQEVPRPDKIVIKELEVETQIGVTAEERAGTQRLLISVELERDGERAVQRHRAMAGTREHEHHPSLRRS